VALKDGDVPKYWENKPAKLPQNDTDACEGHGKDENPRLQPPLIWPQKINKSKCRK